MDTRPAPDEVREGRLLIGPVRLAAMLGLMSAVACSGAAGDVAADAAAKGGAPDRGNDASRGSGGDSGPRGSDGSWADEPGVGGGAGSAGNSGAGGGAGSSGATASGGAGGGTDAKDTGDGGASGDARQDQSLTGGGGGGPPDASIDSPEDAAPDAGLPDQGVPGEAAPDGPFDAQPDSADVQDAADSIADQAAPPDGADGAVPGRYLTVVAHPDDDILFLNPDLETFMRQGPSCTVYLTSGDASEVDRGWPAREAGILSAQARMAGVANNWSCQGATYGSRPVWRCLLASAQVTAIFLRLPDGQIGLLWGPRIPPPPPPAVQGPVSSITQIPDAGSMATYTHDDLVALLAEIMREFAPNHILTMDSTFAYGPANWDHPDHVGSGLFALMAAQAYGHVDGVRTYRGYTTSFPDPTPLITAEQLAEKTALMQLYGGSCSDDYALWCPHQISYASIIGSGRLRQPPSGRCLQSQGAGVVLTTCNGASMQTWTVGDDGTVVDLNNLCLTVNGTVLSVDDCLGAPEQKWTWFENGQLRGAEGLCVTASGSTALVTDCVGDGSSSTNGSAGPSPLQIWTP